MEYVSDLDEYYAFADGSESAPSPRRSPRGANSAVRIVGQGDTAAAVVATDGGGAGRGVSAGRGGAVGRVGASSQRVSADVPAAAARVRRGSGPRFSVSD